MTREGRGGVTPKNGVTQKVWRNAEGNARMELNLKKLTEKLTEKKAAPPRCRREGEGLGGKWAGLVGGEDYRTLHVTERVFGETLEV